MIQKLMNGFINILENLHTDTHEQYLSNIDAYKDIIDRSPNKFLKFHLDDCIKKEHYELAEYIKQTAIKRNFELV